MPAILSGDGGSLVRRLDAISIDYLTGFSVGPVQVSDVGQGLIRYVWRVQVVGGNIQISRNTDDGSGWTIPTVLDTVPTDWIISELAFAFDQNGSPIVCFEVEGRVWLYWFDPRVGSRVFTDFAQGRTPRLLLDDPETTVDSDVLLVYVSDTNNRIEVRQQRDLYEIVLPTPVTGAFGLHVEKVAKATDNRLHVIYSRRNQVAGTYDLFTLESAPYPYRPHEYVSQVHALLLGGILRETTFLVDTVELVTQSYAEISSGVLSDPTIIKEFGEDSTQIHGVLLDGILSDIMITEQLLESDTQVHPLLLSGMLKQILIATEITENVSQAHAVILSGVLENV